MLQHHMRMTYTLDLQPEQHVLHTDFESTQRISIDTQVLVIVASPHMDVQPQQHAMHIDVESLCNVQLIFMNAQVLVIVAGPHMDVQPEQHAYDEKQLFVQTLISTPDVVIDEAHMLDMSSALTSAPHASTSYENDIYIGFAARTACVAH